MRLRNLFVAVVVVGGFALPVRAADPVEPTIVLKFKSVEGMIADAKYVLGLAGQEEAGKQLEALIDSQVGKNGLVGTGLDTKKPFGLYLTVGAAGVDSTGAVMIPVADQKAFVAFVSEQLEAKNVKVTPGADGIYTISSNQAPVAAFLAFAHGYAYVTVIDKDPISGDKRMTPEKLFPAGDPALVSLTARLDKVPDLLKQLGFGALENRLADIKDPKRDAGKGPESDTLVKARSALVDKFAETVKAWIDQAGSLTVAATVDRAAEELSFDAKVTGKDGSDLAATIRGLSTATTKALGSDLAGQFGLNVAIPDAVRPAAVQFVEVAFRDAMAREKDVGKKAILRMVFDALLPTVQAGRLNVMAGLRGPKADGKYSLLAGVQLADEKKIEGLVKELYPAVPAEVRDKVKLNAKEVAGTAVHVVDSPKDMNADTRRVFGDTATIQVAFPKGLMLLALGNDAGDALKSALTETGTWPAPPMIAEGSLLKLAPLEKDHADAAKAVAQKVFGNAGTGGDVVRFSLQGGSALHFRASVKALAIKYAGLMKEEVEGRR